MPPPHQLLPGSLHLQLCTLEGENPNPNAIPFFLRFLHSLFFLTVFFQLGHCLPVQLSVRPSSCLAPSCAFVVVVVVVVDVGGVGGGAAVSVVAFAGAADGDGGGCCSSSVRARKIPSNILNCECWKCFMAFQLDLFPFCMFYLFIFASASATALCWYFIPHPPTHTHTQSPLLLCHSVLCHPYLMFFNHSARGEFCVCVWVCLGSFSVSVSVVFVVLFEEW